jgi:uncharacterized membrane protein
MESRSTAKFVCIAVLLLIAFQFAYYYPRLPVQVASHFDARGVPNDWSSKAGFFAIMGSVIALIALIFLGFGVWLPRMPVSIVNLPNKRYWFAPERRNETMSVLTGYMFWFGAATLAFMAGILQQTFEANLNPGQRLDRPWLYLGPYLAVTAVWTILLLWRFGRIPKGPRQSSG